MGQADRRNIRRWLNILAWLLAGMCLGLAAQTYHTGRLGILTATALVLVSARSWQRKLACLSTVILALLITAWPLINYALERPQRFNARVDTVFLLSEEALAGQAPLAALDASIGRHMLMLNVHGDDNGRHHAPGRPMLDILTGLLLLLGLGLLMRPDRRSLFVIIGLLSGAAPSLLAVESPHAMRSIHVLSFACILAALGLVYLWDSIFMPIRRLRAALVAGLLTVVACLNIWLYFIEMPKNIGVWGSFYPFHTQIGSYIRNVANEQGPEAATKFYVPASLAENPVFGYLTYALAVHNYPEAGNIDLPADAQLVVTGAIKEIELRNLIERYQLNPEPMLVGPLLPDQHTPSFRFYSRR